MQSVDESVNVSIGITKNPSVSDVLGSIAKGTYATKASVQEE